jgi:hypothetical protein
MVKHNMHKLSDEERNLLRHYAEGERVVSGLQRMPAHRHLVGVGYIQEPPMGGQNVLIAVTDTGRKALQEA